MTNKYLFTLTAALMLLLMYPFATKAQDNNTYNITKPIYNYQFKVGLTAAMYDKIHLDNIGAELLKTSYFPSYEVSLSFSKHLAKNYYINSALSFSTIPLKYQYYFASPENSVFHQNPYYAYLDLNKLIFIQDIEALTVSINKLMKTKKNHELYSFEAGLRINRLIANNYEITFQSIYEIDSLNDYGLFKYYHEDFGSRYKLSGILKSGKVIKNKKGNYFHYNFVIHYCPSPIGYGWYKFYNLGLESFGTLWQHMNYLGFEFCYGF